MVRPSCILTQTSRPSPELEPGTQMVTVAIDDPLVCATLQTEHPTALQLVTSGGTVFIVGNGGCALHRDYVSAYHCFGIVNAYPDYLSYPV